MRSGFLIRFIDLGLIILFGFMMISDIDNYAQIEMTERGDDAAQTSEEETVLLAVNIAPDGTFALVDPATQTTYSPLLRSLDLLQAHLTRLQASTLRDGAVLTVLINPHEDSIVQHTVDVMDVCDRLNLSRNLHAPTPGRLP